MQFVNFITSKTTTDNSFQLECRTDSTGSIVYSGSDSTIADVSSTGIVTISGAGDVIITATQAGTNIHSSVTTTATLTITKLSNTLLINDIIKSIDSPPFQLKPITDSTGAFTFTSSHPEVASVDSTGLVTINSSGTTNLTINQAASNIHNDTSKTISLTINDKITPVLTMNNIVKTDSDPTFNMNAISTISTTSNQIKYKSSNTNIATIDESTGIVNILIIGKTIITAYQEDDTKYNYAYVQATLTIVKTKTTTIGSVNYTNKPVKIEATTNMPNLSSIVVNIADTQYTNPTGIAYALNTNISGVVSKFTITAFNTTNEPITNFLDYPITLELDLPNSDITHSPLRLYKVDPSLGSILQNQPLGYPAEVNYDVLNKKWNTILHSLSVYVAVDTQHPSGSAGGDPYILTVKKEQYKIPDDWKYVNMYDHLDYKVCIKCGFIDNMIIKGLHRLNPKKLPVIIDPKKYKYVTTTTYIKELDVYKNNILISKIDTINDKILNAENIIKKPLSAGLYSIINKLRYYPKEASSYLITLNSGNYLELTIDKYWDEINNINLIFNDYTNIDDYTGEFFKHDEKNKLEIDN